MIARLWWKEARQVWPIWVFLAGLGLVWMAAIQWRLAPHRISARPVAPLTLGGPALLVTIVYLLMIGAAVFAGERENRTMGFLDALPVERWRAWVAKASFAAASTLALGALLGLFALVFESLPPANDRLLIGFLLLCGLGWTLLWSALSSNAMLAAALSIGSLLLTYTQLTAGQLITVGWLAGEPPRLEVWILPLALLAASAVTLQLGGPPRPAWLGTRRRPRAELLETMDADIGRRRSIRVWPTSASRLIWQTRREIWPLWWRLMALSIVLPLAILLTGGLIDPALWVLGGLLVSPILGANVFNAENRDETRRFLAGHGARPGVVWLIKLTVGLIMVAPIWLVWSAPSLGGVSRIMRVPAGGTGRDFGWMFFIGFLASSFASGALGGMVFRRGITAALISVILWFVVSLPPFLLLMWGLLWPSHVIWIAVAMLAVTWSWSGDWLLDRPGVGRWLRLALYSATAVAVLVPAYVAERAWSVPAIEELEREWSFESDWIVPPLPPEENAADAYREIAAAGLGHPRVGGESLDYRTIVDQDWDASDPKLLDWLARNEANLEALRKAAAMPACRFGDFRTMTVFSAQVREAGTDRFALALAASSRVRFGRGDLKGAWDDIEALLRMARQFSGLNPVEVRYDGRSAEGWGLALAMRWAADPRQTAESLETARASYRALPPPPSLIDELAAEAQVVRNTADMPREDLVRGLGSGDVRRRRSTLDQLSLDAMTTPWELTRFRRVYEQLARARVQLVGRESHQGHTFPRLDAMLNNVTVNTRRGLFSVPATRLQRLAQSAPLVREFESRPIVALPRDSNAASRRALDLILALRLWQVQHGGKLPHWLDEIAADDPDIPIIDPFINPSVHPRARFGYIPSQGQSLLPLGFLDWPPSDRAAGEAPLEPTDGYMLLYSVGPDERDNRAASNLDPENWGDIIFPLKDDVPPPE